MSKLQIGFGRTNITPMERVPLAGYGNTSRRISTTILDFLYATCAAISDENETVLLYNLDLTSAFTEYMERFIPAIAAETGVKEDNIFLCNTHNHSAPDFENKNHETSLHYIEFLEKQLLAAAKAALADRKPVTKMQVGSIETEGMNFVRRYVLADGTYAGDNYGHFEESPIACHESEPDRTLQLVKFVRDGGKDIVLGNFQMHPHRTGGGRKPVVSSDIVGVMRDTLEKDTDVHFLYFTGGSGNVNGHSMVKEENITPDHTAHGKAMAEYAKKVPFRDVDMGPVKAVKKVVSLPVDHSQDHRVEDAQKFYDYWMEGHKRAQWLPVAKKMGFNSPYQAQAIMKKALLGSHLEMPIWAFRVGDVGFACAPYEMFDTNGVQIKESSPFAATVVCTCTNGRYAYIPSKLGFEHGGYSVDICRYTPGVGEMLAEEYVELLKSIR